MVAANRNKHANSHTGTQGGLQLGFQSPGLLAKPNVSISTKNLSLENLVRVLMTVIMVKQPNLQSAHETTLSCVRTKLIRTTDLTEVISTHNGRNVQPRTTPSSHPGDEFEDNMPAPTYTNAASNAVLTPTELAAAPSAQQEHSPVQVPKTMTSSELNRKVEQIYNLSITRFLHSGIEGDEKEHERKALLLYHPEDHSEDLELITRWLLMHECEVGNMWYDGAWSHFRQEMADGKSGILIVRSISLPIVRTLAHTVRYIRTSNNISTSQASAKYSKGECACGLLACSQHGTMSLVSHHLHHYCNMTLLKSSLTAASSTSLTMSLNRSRSWHLAL